MSEDLLIEDEKLMKANETHEIWLVVKRMQKAFGIKDVSVILRLALRDYIVNNLEKVSQIERLTARTAPEPMRNLRSTKRLECRA